MCDCYGSTWTLSSSFQCWWQSSLRRWGFSSDKGLWKRVRTLDSVCVTGGCLNNTIPDNVFHSNANKYFDVVLILALEIWNKFFTKLNCLYSTICKFEKITLLLTPSPGEVSWNSILRIETSDPRQDVFSGFRGWSGSQECRGGAYGIDSHGSFRISCASNSDSICPVDCWPKRTWHYLQHRMLGGQTIPVSRFHLYRWVNIGLCNFMAISPYLRSALKKA